MEEEKVWVESDCVPGHCHSLPMAQMPQSVIDSFLYPLSCDNSLQTKNAYPFTIMVPSQGSGGLVYLL